MPNREQASRCGGPPVVQKRAAHPGSTAALRHHASRFAACVRNPQGSSASIGRPAPENVCGFPPPTRFRVRGADRPHGQEQLFAECGWDAAVEDGSGPAASARHRSAAGFHPAIPGPRYPNSGRARQAASSEWGTLEPPGLVARGEVVPEPTSGYRHGQPIYLKRQKLAKEAELSGVGLKKCASSEPFLTVFSI